MKEQGVTVDPAIVPRLLRDAAAACDRQWGDQDHPGSAIRSALVGFGNLQRQLAAAQAELAETQESLTAYQDATASVGLERDDMRAERDALRERVAAVEAHGEECDISRDPNWVNQFYCSMHCVWFRFEEEPSWCPAGEIVAALRDAKGGE